MSEVTVLPAENQTSLLFESPLSPAEKARKLSLYTKSKAAALDKFNRQRIMADCLNTIYQELLFRGDHGSRTWGDYLASGELELMGYQQLNTETAGMELMWHHLCAAIDEWNSDNPDRPTLPFPQGRSYMDGWATLFQRRRAAGAPSYTPFEDKPAEAALKAWYSACIKQPDGKTPNREISRSIGRQCRDSGMGRPMLAQSSTNRIGEVPLAFSAPPVGGLESSPRTVDPAALEQAAADAAARASRQKAAQRQDAEDLKAGIDPRSIRVEERDELDALEQCQKYRALLNNAYSATQALQVFVRSKINSYGSDYLTFLRQVDAGIWSVDNDISVIEQSTNYLATTLDLCQGHYQAGELDPDNNTPEPTR